MLIKRILPLIIVAVVYPCLMNAQVTTSSITGAATSSTGEALEGATITATHLPTGTIYRGSSLSRGVFNLVNLTPGGPYRLETSFTGYERFIQDSIYLALGENTRIDIPLIAAGTTLSEVVITASGDARRKTGASTNISRAQISALPTLSRSIQDYTRLTPQANGNSFGGSSNRYNNITIDGAVNNDVFG